MTSSKTTTASGNSWTNVRVSVYPRKHLTVSTRTDDQYAHLLTLSGIIPNALPSYENMTPSEFETFLQEMEPDIRAADRDMREIEALDQKGVAAVGKLTSVCSPLPFHPLMRSPPQITKHCDHASARFSKLTNKIPSLQHPWKNELRLS